jgi:hypothetical protein
LRAPATNLGESSQHPPGTFLNKPSPGFEPTDELLVRLNELGHSNENRGRTQGNTRKSHDCSWDQVRCYAPLDSLCDKFSLLRDN